MILIALLTERDVFAIVIWETAEKHRKTEKEREMKSTRYRDRNSI